MNKKEIDSKELERELGVSYGTLHRYRKRGMPCIKYGHSCIAYDLVEVKKWLRTQTDLLEWRRKLGYVK